MELTKRQRLEHYKKMLTYFQEGKAIGFCSCSVAVGEISILDLPEIMEYEPKDHDLYWFYDSTTRPSILMEIISKMETEQI
jgi:hypothetical protein